MRDCNCSFPRFDRAHAGPPKPKPARYRPPAIGARPPAATGRRRAAGTVRVSVVAADTYGPRLGR